MKPMLAALALVSVLMSAHAAQAAKCVDLSGKYSGVTRIPDHRGGQVSYRTEYELAQKNCDLIHMRMTDHYKSGPNSFGQQFANLLRTEDGGPGIQWVNSAVFGPHSVIASSITLNTKDDPKKPYIEGVSTWAFSRDARGKLVVLYEQGVHEGGKVASSYFTQD